MVKKLFGLTVFALILAAFLGASPVSAAELPGTPTVALAVAPPAGGCGQAPILPAVKGETCPAAAAPRTQTPEPEFMAQPTRLKTCVCSCGLPCTSDADCGGALGSCRLGITCC